MSPLVEQLHVVGEGSLGREGPDLPVLHSAQHRAEAGVGGPRLGPGSRLVLGFYKCTAQRP